MVVQLWILYWKGKVDFILFAFNHQYIPISWNNCDTMSLMANYIAQQGDRNCNSIRNNANKQKGCSNKIEEKWKIMLHCWCQHQLKSNRLKKPYLTICVQPICSKNIVFIKSALYIAHGYGETSMLHSIECHPITNSTLIVFCPFYLLFSPVHSFDYVFPSDLWSW